MFVSHMLPKICSRHFGKAVKFFKIGNTANLYCVEKNESKIYYHARKTCYIVYVYEKNMYEFYDVKSGDYLYQTMSKNLAMVAWSMSNEGLPYKYGFSHTHVIADVRKVRFVLKADGTFVHQLKIDKLYASQGSGKYKIDENLDVVFDYFQK